MSRENQSIQPAADLPGRIEVTAADYHNPQHAAALVDLLDAYARDPAGGGQALSEFARQRLVATLAGRPQAFSVLAFHHGARAVQAVGLVNCFEGFSTFACQPLVNIHDVVVLAEHRGQGVAARMLALVEQLAVRRGACKLTLEVLQGNWRAQRLYQRIGFAAYQLDPALGSAQFLQKPLLYQDDLAPARPHRSE